MPNRIIDGSTNEGKKYPIQPKHINVKEHFRDAFPDCDTEISARLIVSLYQKKGGWVSFTHEEINEHAEQYFRFYGLNDEWDQKNENNYVILGEDGGYWATHEFIVTCFKSSPEY